MAEEKRKPGRPRKHIGLALPELLRKIPDGTPLRDVQDTTEGQNQPILSDARGGSPAGDGSRRIFGAADDLNVGRPESAAIVPAVSDTPGRADDLEDLRLGQLWKRLLRMPAPPKYQTQDGRVLTSAEVLAARMLDDAMAGDRSMRELVLAHTEGKPGTKQEQRQADTSVEEQIDRAAVAHLNSLLPLENQ